MVDKLWPYYVAFHEITAAFIDNNPVLIRGLMKIKKSVGIVIESTML